MHKLVLILANFILQREGYFLLHLVEARALNIWAE